MLLPVGGSALHSVDTMGPRAGLGRSRFVGVEAQQRIRGVAGRRILAAPTSHHTGKLLHRPKRIFFFHGLNYTMETVDSYL